MRQGYDLNELLLLYSYVFSPKKVPYLTPRGLSLLQIPDYFDVSKDYTVDPKVAVLYLQTAMQVVLDLSRYSTDRIARLAAGVPGDFYFLIMRFSSSKKSSLSQGSPETIGVAEAAGEESPRKNHPSWNLRTLFS